MLETMIIILLVLWGLGLVTFSSMGGMVHILLAVAIVAALIRVRQVRAV